MDEFLVVLYRDSLHTPWGFRLEGGQDFKQPLTIQRVFQGSPAASDLLRGDVITAIHNEDARFLQHQEANDLIRNSGGSLTLGIKRAPGAAQMQFQPFQSYKKTMDFKDNFMAFTLPGEEDDASKKYRNSKIDQYKSPKTYLSQTGSPFLPEYQPFTVGECSSVQRRIENRLLPKTDLTFAKPSYPKFANTNHYPQPFVDRRMIGNIQQNLTRAVHAPGVVYPRDNHSVPALPKTHMKVGKYDVKTFSNQLGFSKGPSVSSNHSLTSNQSASGNNGPKIISQQYNSPIGLYSNNTLKEELTKQIQFNSNSANDFNGSHTNSASAF